MQIELNETTRKIFGIMCFTVGPLVRLMREVGHDVKTKAEDEQAAVIHWRLNLYLEHGENHEKVAGEIIDKWIAEVKAKKPEASE